MSQLDETTQKGTKEKGKYVQRYDRREYISSKYISTVYNNIQWKNDPIQKIFIQLQNELKLEKN